MQNWPVQESWKAPNFSVGACDTTRICKELHVKEDYIRTSITSCLQESSVDVVRRQLQCFATRMDELLLLGSYK